jgi:hypothetical protein
MAEPEDQMERDLVELFEEARRKLFTGPLAKLPQHMRRVVMAGIEMTNPETGKVICTLADDDYLERFRRQRH